jgi:hypothetical protein
MKIWTKNKAIIWTNYWHDVADTTPIITPFSFAAQTLSLSIDFV